MQSYYTHNITQKKLTKEFLLTQFYFLTFSYSCGMCQNESRQILTVYR